MLRRQRNSMNRIITISREYGAAGGTVGRAVAKKLGYEYYDKANKACEIEERTEKLDTVDGYCDYRTREIHILKDEGMKDDYLKGILFHELTHCMLYQMGYKYHNDEEYVEKIAKFATILNDISKEINDKLTK